ncbi:ABC transporter permease [Martelella mangrovi]|uniref:Peptide/nickel transport system permease protein n=1 Tax=Martelella mangrovi TaxID=1397477 RepID=A0ABV2IDJ1_9HYPH|nr:ABC transporter permease [uncultured Martelella sp.]
MTDFLKRLVRTPQGAIGTALVVLVLLAAVFGPMLAPYGAEDMSPLARFQGPEMTHLFGTDQYGRDILSRLLVGARATVLMAVAATLLGAAIGAVLGTTSAYLGGRFDEAIMRTVDAVMAIPSLLFALLIVNLLGTSAVNALLSVAIAFAPGMARITRSVALSVRKQDYVSAAVARGEGTAYIVLREMLPNVVAPIIIEMTIRVSFAVLLFATLSFLGLGAQPPAAEWGLMISEARQYMHRSVWLLLWPCLAIATVAIGFNLLGDGLRDAFNPKTA